MIYLDYSATTPVSKEVLKTFNDVCNNYIGNPNSLHKLGIKSRKLMDSCTKEVANILNVDKEEVIFTSSASESNNMAIIGIINKYPERGKRIITTKLEHSSILEVVNYLKRNGFTIDYVNILENGQVDLNHLKSLLNDETVLVSINYVNSEIGIKQPIQEISKIIKENSNAIFHVDGTQAVGKIKVDLTGVDLFSFSAHKFYGLKGIACLIKKKDIELEPIIHGGKSQTIYRSGTPTLPLIASLAKALKLATKNLDKKYNHVLEINNLIKEGLKDIENVYINSNDVSIPHILNISVVGMNSEKLLEELSKKDIYVSIKSACSSDSTKSHALIAMKKSDDIARSSLRISLSYLTTKKEALIFLETFKKIIKKFQNKKIKE